MIYYCICDVILFYFTFYFTSLKNYTRKLFKDHGSVYIDKLKFRDSWYFIRYVDFFKNRHEKYSAKAKTKENLGFYQEEVDKISCVL